LAKKAIGIAHHYRSRHWNDRAIESKKDIGAWGLTPEETASFVLSGLRSADFFILPLSDSGHIQMRDSLEARYAELRGALEKSSNEKSYKP
jgi:hypothetical protein